MILAVSCAMMGSERGSSTVERLSTISNNATILYKLYLSSLGDFDFALESKLQNLSM
jgi:hypothetical protein